MTFLIAGNCHPHKQGGKAHQCFLVLAKTCTDCNNAQRNYGLNSKRHNCSNLHFSGRPRGVQDFTWRGRI